MRGFNTLVLGLVGSLFMLSCGGPSGSTSTPQPSPPVPLVQALPEALTLPPGGSARLSATVSGPNAQDILWTTDAGAVDNQGFFTAPAVPGLVTVTAASKAFPGSTSTILVVVEADASPSLPGGASSTQSQASSSSKLFLWPSSMTLPEGEPAWVLAYPIGDVPQDLAWTVLESGGGTVVSAGSLGGFQLASYTAPAGSGSFHIQVSSASQPSLNATSTITVRAKGQVSVSVKPDTASLLMGQTQAFLATVSGAKNKRVTWSVVESSGGAIDAAGQYLAPISTGIFHVKATSVADPTKSAQATVSVNAMPSAPTISAFTATPSTITAGQSSALVWTVTGATSLSIDHGVGTVTGSSLSVSPTSTTTYTLTATNAGGTRTATATVTVNPAAPTISAFTGTPSAITAGQNSTLAWTVTGATSLSIDHGVGTVTGSSLSVSPTSTTTYTLTATNTGGSRTATTTVTVNPVAPTINTFTATPFTITEGQSCRLAWAVTGATSLSIDHGVGTVTGSSFSVSPTSTTTYTLTATNAGGSRTATATVTVNPAAPTISAFTATPPTITTGQSSTLAWAVTGATSLSIDHGVGTITGSSLSVSPTSTTTYTLTAANAGGTRTATATVTVNPATPAPTINAFTGTPSTITAGQSCTLAWTVTGATSLSIDSGVGTVTGSSLSVSPTATTTFTLTATNTSGSTTASALVTVNPVSGLNHLQAYNSGPSGTLGLVNNWIREAWEGTPAIATNFNAPAPGRSGAQAIEVTFGAGNGWNAIGFAHRIDWNTVFPLFMNQFRTFEFDIQFVAGSTGVDNLNFILEDGGHADEPALTSLISNWSTMTPAQKYGVWHHISVDLTAIHPEVAQYPSFERILFFNNADGGASQPHFYLADVKLGWVNDSTPPVITFASAISNLTNNQLTLSWGTDEPTVQKVEYGTTNAYGQMILGGTTDSDYALNHTVVMPSLTPGTTYAYRITASDHQFLAATPPNRATYTGTFTMASAPTNPPVISGLSATHVDGATATLAWTTDRACSETFTYQKGGGALMTRTLTDFALTRTFMLDLLEPSTAYLVTIVATDAFNNHSIPATITVNTTDSSAADVTITIDPVTTKPISPWIYGLNFYGSVTGAPPHLTLNRMGGNRWTAYNWENNASNSGSDWGPYSNDNYLGGGTTPGEAVRGTIAADQARGMASLMTIQLQGYVSADTNGLVDVNDPNHIANRFKQVINKKGSAFTATPSASDASAYMDEFLWALRGKFTGDIFASSAVHPTFVSLDNEPELWSSTHFEIQPTMIDPETYIQKTIALTKALKDVAPQVQLFGPVHYGFNGIVNWQNAAGFTDAYWFTDKYLQEMKIASDAYGKRLLDAYDLHWYSEATGDGTRITNLTGATLTDNQVQAIVQSPRSMWDPTYTEASWVADYLGGPVNLLGRLQAKIDLDWPGTKLAITEYGNGGDNHIAGAIAQADNLGVFGSQGVFAATLWPLSNDIPFTLAGFRMFRGFDGGGACFGDTSLKTTSSNVQNVVAYVSTDSTVPGRIVVVAINRSRGFQSVALNGQHLMGTAYVYRLTADIAHAQQAASQPVQPVHVGDVPVNGNSWTVALPPMSVSTIEIK